MIRAISFYILFSLFCVVSLTLTQAHATRGVTQSEYAIFTEAKKALDSKDYKASQASLEKYFRQKGEKHHYGYELYGVILLNTKQYKKAVTILQQGADAYPKNVNIMQNLASAYYQSRQMFKAGQAYEKAYTLTGRKNHQLASTAGYCYLQAKKYTNAINVLKALVALAKPQALWFQMLGQAYFAKGDKKSAVATIERGLQHFQENPELWRLLGYLYYELKQREKAAAAYEIAYKFKAPSRGEAEQLAGLYYSLMAPLSGKRLLSFQNTPVLTLDYVGVLFAQAGDYPTAIQVTKLALQKKYTTARQFRLAQIYHSAKSFSEAKEIFRSLVKSGGASSESGGQNYAEKSQWMLAEMAWDKKDWKTMVAELELLENMQGPLAPMATQLLTIARQLADEKLDAFAHHEQ